MTREENEAWVTSLKPGDVVIHKRWNKYLRLLHVKKVTPTGIIRTEEGNSFKISNWSGMVRGYGSTDGELAPAADELISLAEKQQKEREGEKERRCTVNSAIYTARTLKTERITFEFAKDFLELCKKHGIG